MSADGAFDTEAVYKEIAKRGARPTIPPCADAVLKRGRDLDRYQECNRNLAEIKAWGKQAWKLSSGYSRRSHDETAFSRIKRRLGDRLHTRRYESQLGELLLFARIINQMTALGMPQPEWTPA